LRLYLQCSERFSEEFEAVREPFLRNAMGAEESQRRPDTAEGRGPRGGAGVWQGYDTVVKKMEAVGSGGGTPSKEVLIDDCGELL